MKIKSDSKNLIDIDTDEKVEQNEEMVQNENQSKSIMTENDSE